MTKINIDLNTLTIEPADEYHAKAKQHLSSHRLIDFLRCPLLFHKKTVGLIGDKERKE